MPPPISSMTINDLSRNYAVLEAPSALGLRPAGVQDLASALLDVGFAERLNARRAGAIVPGEYNDQRDAQTGFLNSAAVTDYAIRLSAGVSDIHERNEFPIVLGGDCSILLGALLALRRRGQYGLLFIDGHTDFFQADANVNGEIASSELALAIGRGPEILTRIEGFYPLILKQDVVAFGFRDEKEAASYGSQTLDADILAVNLAAIHKTGVDAAVTVALSRLSTGTRGFWIHLDADVLDDAIMPAVDYRIAGGLSWNELVITLRTALETNRCVGLDVTIFNPRLDQGGVIAKKFVDTLVEALELKGR